MQTTIKYARSSYLPYGGLIEAFKNFGFSKPEYSATGKIKKQTSGACKYAEVTLLMEIHKMQSTFSWEVPEEVIPSAYLDAVLTTIKALGYHSSGLGINFRIINGSYHEVDSSAFSFEIATFRALSQILEFQTEN